ncbi:MAG: FecR family protein [Tannerella sp.]|nr:FecR family protein [Tannerella sp.]
MKNKEDLFVETSRRLIDKLKQAESKNKSDMIQSWEKLEDQFAILRKNRRKIYLYVSSVAVFLALVLAISCFMFLKENTSDDTLFALLNTDIPADSNDIILMANQSQIVIEDESDIMYETDGKMSVNDELLTLPSGKDANIEKKPAEIHQLYVPKGKRVRTVFSDGTIMHVNSDTRVIYPAVFTGNKREIIVDGEVFLDVMPDSTSPFMVKTKGFDVRVLGTRFNVNSYKENSTATVTLVSGSVEVKTPGHKNSILIPNQLYENNGESVSIKEVDVYEYICWIDNIMLIRGKRNVGQIFENLQRFYGVNILYDNNIAGIPISGKLDLREDIGEVLDIISTSLMLKIARDDNNNYVVTLN